MSVLGDAVVSNRNVHLGVCERQESPAVKTSKGNYFSTRLARNESGFEHIRRVSAGAYSDKNIVALYEFGAKRQVDALPPGAAIPARARMIGAVSLATWLAVAACGRSIAYF